MNRVREFRQALEMTQGALAEAAGIHQVQVSYIEIGRTKKPRPKTMTAIAGALGCAVSEVFPDAAPDPGPAAAPCEPERLREHNCRWCGRNYVKDQAAVLIVAGEKIYEAGHVRCLSEYIDENTDRQGNWKKHRNEGL